MNEEKFFDPRETPDVVNVRRRWVGKGGVKCANPAHGGLKRAPEAVYDVRTFDHGHWTVCAKDVAWGQQQAELAISKSEKKPNA